MAAENVNVGRESGIRPAFSASAKAGLLGRQRSCLPLGRGVGVQPGPLLPHTCLSDLSWSPKLPLPTPLS